MKHPPIDLEGLLGTASGMSAKRPEVFALIVLGLLDSLESGVLNCSEVVPLFFHAANCRFVESHLPCADAIEVMGRGSQLPDLYDALDSTEADRELSAQADRELASEIAAMRSRCLAMLADGRLVA